MATPVRAPARAPGPAPARAQAPRPAPGGARGSGPAPGRGSAAASSLLPAGAAPAPVEAVGAKLAEGEVDLSKGNLALDAKVTESVKEGGEVDVRVRLPGLAQGEIKLRRRKDRFSTVRDQGIRFVHPALARFNAANPTVLVLKVNDDVVAGWVGLGLPGPAKGGQRALFDAMAKAGDTLGWLGISAIRIPTVTNRFADGMLDVKAEQLSFTVGGFLSGGGSAALDHKTLSFDGSAKVQIPGGTSGELMVKRDPAGMLAGKLDLAVNIGSVAGNVTATLANGFVSIMGSVAYNGDRMSGKVTLVATDEATARDITLKKPEGGGGVPIELPGPDRPVKPGPRAFCGWGQLTFRVTDWLAGTATVIVNSKGQATVVGEIAPPKEFILFEQKEWVKRLVKLEIRAGYGIPVVGQVGLFASISLDAVAAVGPGKLYQIKLTGAYSTDPRVAKQLAIEGTLNISAFAGLRLRAEAGLVVEILAHDIKAGVGLNAIAGVRGYVEARPKIGMRELQPGKRQYYIQGHLEIAAQPVLGFSGDLFVAIETPWWSPLSDKRWTWPLFAIEYPLPGEFGISADVDYVLGSRQWPSIEFGEVDFDSSKFLTDVMNDNADSGKGGEQKKQGDWKEGKGGGGPGGARNKGGKGKKPGEPGYDSEPVGEQLSFSDGQESHRLWFAEKPGEAVLMVASSEGPLETALRKIDEKIGLMLEPDAARARDLKGRILARLPALGTEARQVATMKEAERKAEETYRKHGKKKGKSKGRKDDRKSKNKKLKADERQLKDMLAGLYTMVRPVPFQPVNGTAPIHGGTVKLQIVAHKLMPAMRVDGAEVVTLFSRLLGGPIGRAHNKAAERLVRASRTQLDQIASAIGKVRIKNGEVHERAYRMVQQQMAPMASIVTRMGTPMRVPNLEPRARQSQPLRPPEIVNFPAYPKSPGAKLYSLPFVTELRRQLRVQERYLNQLRVDEFFFNRALFKMNRDVYLTLDKSARAAVLQELSSRAQKARERTAATVAREEKRLDEVLLALSRHQVRDTVIVIQAGKPDRRIELSYGLRGDIVSQLVRAKQRVPAVSRAHQELERAQREDEMPELIRSRYPGLKEAMNLQIQGRTGGEKKARAHYRTDLTKLLEKTLDWQPLAKKASQLAMAHRGDMVAGGHDKWPLLTRPPGNDLDSKEWAAYLERLREFVGTSDVNSKIGSDWSRRVDEVFKNVRSQVPTHQAQPLYRLNLRLVVQAAT